MSIKIASMNFGDCDTILHNTPNGMKNIAEVLGPNGEVYWSSTKELTGIPPLSIRSNGTMLLDYLISGNMSQSGTPTHDTPIQPQETGERTGNLADLYGVNKATLKLTFTTTGDMKIVVNGTKAAGANVINIAYPNIVLPAGIYTVYIKMVGGTITNIKSGAFFGINNNTYEQRTAPAVNKIGDVGRRTFTLSENTLLSTLDITPSYGDVGSVWNNAEFECMLYSGSDDISYEPYGIKIPISSANTTTPIYLGEVESTRRIKKLVLTGQESTWTASGEAANVYYVSLAGDEHKGTAITTVCTHFKSVRNATNYLHLNNGEMCLYSGTSSSVHTAGFKYPNSSLSDFKSYLAAQYAAGTPVTVWYVLATPTTGIVNEPLRKIRDYADTVSYEQAGVQIPTNRGNTVIDVETTLKPSQMYIKYK